MSRRRERNVGALFAAITIAACGGGPREEVMQMSTTIGATSPSDEESGSGGPDPTVADGSDEPEIKLDTPFVPPTGCNAIDFLFVIDNSSSMATYQAGLAAQFPDFVTAMFDAVPDDISIHVGITTTDFDNQCDAAEATQNCQSTASASDVALHYRTPDTDPDGGNGTQGRLFRFSGRTYFETNSNDDPAELSQWFSQAATAAGEEGCSFEMPVAAAGWVAHPANADTNAGFLRDELALLVVFFLTDEPDKSVASKNDYKDMLLAGKPNCGGEACIFMSGLIPSCAVEINQKIWQFMVLFGNESPPVGDITSTNDYSEVFGIALADAIAEACLEIPIP